MAEDITDFNDSIPLGYSASLFGAREECETSVCVSGSPMSRKSSTSKLLQCFQYNGTPSTIRVHTKQTFGKYSSALNRLTTLRESSQISDCKENVVEGETENNKTKKKRKSKILKHTKQKKDSICDKMHEHHIDPVSGNGLISKSISDNKEEETVIDKNRKTCLSEKISENVQSFHLELPFVRISPCKNTENLKTPERSPVVLHLSSYKPNVTSTSLALDEIIAAKTPARRKKTTRSARKTNSVAKNLTCPADELLHLFDKETMLSSAYKSCSLDSKQFYQSENSARVQNSITKEISEWSITFSKNQVYVEGYTKTKEGKWALFRTSSVTNVKKSGRLIVTSGGSNYQLLGNMLVQASVDAGVPLNIANKFLKGFPPGWRTYCKRCVNMNSSDSGSYQGDLKGLDQNNFSHQINQSMRMTRGSGAAHHHVPNMSLGETENEQSSKNTSNKVISDPSGLFQLPTPSDKSFSPAKPDTGRYASALTPVAEVSICPDDSATTAEAISRSKPTVTVVPDKKKVGRPRSRCTIHTTSSGPLIHEIENSNANKSCRKKQGKSSSYFNYPDVCEIVATRTPKISSKKKSLTGSSRKSTMIKQRKKVCTKECPISEQTTAINDTQNEEPIKPNRKTHRRRKSAKMLYNTPDPKTIESCENEVRDVDKGIRENETKSNVKTKNHVTENHTEMSKNGTASSCVEKTTKANTISENISNTKNCSTSKDNVQESFSNSPQKRKRQIDRKQISSTRVRTRSYKVQISPLDISNISKFSNLPDNDDKKEKDVNEQSEKEKPNSETAPKKKVRKRKHENADIARPKKRSKKSTKSDNDEPQEKPAEPTSAIPIVTETVSASKSRRQNDNSASRKQALTAKSKAKKTNTKPVQEKKWTDYQKKKLRKLVNEGLAWEEISIKMMFSVEDCEKVNNQILANKGKSKKQKAAKENKGPVEVTARPGTLKHRQQVHDALEVLKKPKPQLQDFFSADGFGFDDDNILSSDMFKAPEENNFVPLTPNTRPPVSMDATLATPAWFKMPTSSTSQCNWGPMTDAQTPAELKQIFSPESEVFVDKDKQRKEADRVIVRMKKKMMRGTLLEYDNVKNHVADPKDKSRQLSNWNSNLDFESLKKLEQAQKENDDNDTDGSDQDEYFDSE